MMKDQNIVLIGMPAVGKSTIGVILAKELGYDFLDSDVLIQQTTQKLLKEIIAEEGIDGFLEIESRVNQSISQKRTVIATGGSAVYKREAMEHFKKNGTIVYLCCPFEILEKRLSDIKGRGVVLREGQTLRGLYEERVPYYERYADLTIEESENGLEETLRRIMEALRTMEK